MYKAPYLAKNVLYLCDGQKYGKFSLSLKPISLLLLIKIWRFMSDYTHDSDNLEPLTVTSSLYLINRTSQRIYRLITIKAIGNSKAVTVLLYTNCRVVSKCSKHLWCCSLLQLFQLPAPSLTWMTTLSMRLLCKAKTAPAVNSHTTLTWGSPCHKAKHPAVVRWSQNNGSSPLVTAWTKPPQLKFTWVRWK